jgi:hypothetical protein
MDNTEKRLNQFQKEHKAVTKGPLSLLIQLTRMIKTKKFPLNHEEFLTENKGQVLGLGGGNLKKILSEYGITRTLASEGGRTSRGNMGLMMKYIEFLNAWDNSGKIDFTAVEQYWADRVNDYFSNQPFTLTADPARTIGASLDELFEQAKNRQKENPGTQYLGTILQHLVAAKLSLILPLDKFEIHGSSVADAPTDRGGDFVINNTIIHCTTAPGEPLIQKCKANINAGGLPVIITIFDRVKTAFDLASDAELSGRVDVWDIQQFLATNINEHSLFDSTARNTKLADIIEKYNSIIDEKETDPSLKIEFDAK